MAGGILRLVGSAELTMLSAMLVVFVAHSLWLVVTVPPAERRLVERRQGLVRLIGGQSPFTAPTSRQDCRRSQRALEEVASSVSGDGEAWIEQAAHQLGLSERAQRWCRSRWWWHRLRGVRSFGLLGGGGDIVPVLLDDVHPLVREAAARWVARHPSAVLAERVVAMLDDPERRCRITAEDVLIRLGATAAEPLAAYLRRSTCPGRPLALEVATALADGRFLTAGLRAAGDPDPAVRSHAATLLAAIAGADSEEALVGLLHDTSEPVRVAATRGLGMIGSWALVPKLAGQLTDSAWDVRREAALALRRVGPAGRLYLRRALLSPDPYAADMAHQVLDLPGTAAD